MRTRSLQGVIHYSEKDSQVYLFVVQLDERNAIVLHPRILFWPPHIEEFSETLTVAGQKAAVNFENGLILFKHIPMNVVLPDREKKNSKGKKAAYVSRVI